jgi:hypothetical protein
MAVKKQTALVRCRERILYERMVWLWMGLIIERALAPIARLAPTVMSITHTSAGTRTKTSTTQCHQKENWKKYELTE